ncbi:MAG TPA: sigma-70 family RNA polymerase sigma factor [Aquaticitalea sp.]|nr:sigma-70 family RNA polymerase sigma factor [Aquaticitalea sp.]
MEPVEAFEMSQQEKQSIITETVSSYGEKLMSFIQPKVKSNEDAEDILQEVWYQFSNITNLSQIVNVGSWLYTATRNKITDNYRKKKTANLEDFPYDDDYEVDSIRELLLIDNEKNPELKMFQEEIWDALIIALHELPEKQRLVYVENELEDKTLQQIANEQNENIKTIISRKQYAVKHLRNQLKQVYEDLNSN